MAEKKRPEIFDHEGDIFRKDYAPAIAAILRRLVELNEVTFKDAMDLQLGNSPVENFHKRLSILLSENLKQVVKEVFELGSLSQLSLLAFREAAGYPREAL